MSNLTSLEELLEKDIRGERVKELKGQFKKVLKKLQTEQTSSTPPPVTDLLQNTPALLDWLWKAIHRSDLIGSKDEPIVKGESISPSKSTLLA